MTTFFKKSKYSNFGAILGNFCLNLGENESSWKKGLFQFLYIIIMYYGAKNLKRVTTCSDKNAKLLMHRQTKNSGFIGPSIGWAQKIKFGIECDSP